MAMVVRIVCLVLLVSAVHGWGLSSMFEQGLPSIHLPTSADANSTSASIFGDMNRMMANMHQRFQRLFGSSSSSLFPLGQADDLAEDRKKLDEVEPVCTTSNDASVSTSTAMGMQKAKRKKLRATQTRTCVKELTIGGRKHLYKEMNVTDAKGILISQSKIYQTVSMDTNNSTGPIDLNGERDVIPY